MIASPYSPQFPSTPQGGDPGWMRQMRPQGPPPGTPPPMDPGMSASPFGNRQNAAAAAASAPPQPQPPPSLAGGWQDALNQSGAQAAPLAGGWQDAIGNRQNAAIAAANAPPQGGTPAVTWGAPGQQPMPYRPQTPMGSMQPGRVANPFGNMFPRPPGQGPMPASPRQPMPAARY